MRRFVLQAAAVADVTETVVLFGDERGIAAQRITDIIQSHFTVDVGSRPFPVSFQRVILPLIYVVTTPQFMHVPYPS